MFRKQVGRVKRKLMTQTHFLTEQLTLVTDRRRNRSKRKFIDYFAEKIRDSVPNVSREDINIITTGFLAELRSLDKPIMDDIIN